MSLSEYFNDIKHNRIGSYKDALKYDSVRYSTYNNSYPKDALIPACTLSQFGFYFDDKNKTIKCVECSFQYENLNNDLLSDILAKHYKHNKSCEKANECFKSCLDQKIKLSKEENDLDRATTTSAEINAKYTNLGQSVPLTQPKKLNPKFTSEENRLKSFENTKMLFDARTLAYNGFYKVLNDNSSSSSSSKMDMSGSMAGSASSNSLVDIDLDEPSQIAQIAKSVPALIHIKCVFCDYECLLFRNSLLNSIYKSPFDEHKEKSFDKCQIFKNEFNKTDLTGITSPLSTTSSSSSSNSSSGSLENILFKKQINTKTKDKWLQALFDFESNSSENLKNAMNMIARSQHFDDIIELKQLPKIIDQLVQMNNIQINERALSLNNDNIEAVLYTPQANTGASGVTTSDFNRLQNVLNSSDNVISDKAYHPAYTLYQTRLESFKEWPATLSQQPADLAKAGFYYFGIKDMVKCFFCNGGLKNWDHNDDPFQDHVRWFPKCQFIRQLMGAAYVEQIKEKFKNMDSGFTNDFGTSSNQLGDTNGAYNTTSSSFSNSYGANLRPKRPVSPRTLNSRLDTHIVRKITDSNVISREAIKQSLELKLAMTSKTNVNTNSNTRTNLNTNQIYGDDFKTPFEMAKMSYDLDKMKFDKIELFKSISDILICCLPNKITMFCLKELFSIRYNVYPTNVRLIKEQGDIDNRTFGLVCLKQEDMNEIDVIVQDLNRKPFPGFDETSPSLLVIKTNWIEIEEKVKPLIGKPVTVSSALEHQLSQQSSAGTLQSQNSTPTSLQRDDTLVNTSASTSATLKPTTKQADANSSKLNEKQPMKDSNEQEMNDESAMQLQEENQRLKNERLCVICLNKDKNVLFLPCAHLAACLECSLSLKTCPICRAKIQASVRTFT